jgi:hypothetical protein
MVATTAAQPQAGSTETSYAFSQQPRAVSNRQKFRDPAQQAGPAAGGTDDRLAVNIMWDRYCLQSRIFSVVSFEVPIFVISWNIRLVKSSQTNIKSDRQYVLLSDIG